MALRRATSCLARRRLCAYTSHIAARRTARIAPTTPRMMPKAGRIEFRVDPGAEAKGTEGEVADVVPKAFDALDGVDPAAPNADDASTTEDTCVTTVVAPEMISVETRVVLKGAEESTRLEVAGLVGGEPPAEEAVNTGDVSSGVGDVVGAGSAAVEGGDAVGCGLLEVEVCVGLGEGVAVVDEVADVVATALVARAR